MSAQFYEGIAKRWRIPDTCTSFARAMLEIYPDWDVLYYLEKPWKWAPEMAAWAANGKPTAAGEPGFMKFANEVMRLDVAL